MEVGKWRLQHPAAADVHNLTGNIFRFFRREKRNGSGNVFDRRRTADGKPRVFHAASFVKSQIFLIDTGRIDDIYGDAVLGFLERERTRKRDDRSLRRSVSGNFLPDRTRAPLRPPPKLMMRPPAAAAHMRQRGSAHEDNAHQVGGKKYFCQSSSETFCERTPAEIADVVDQHVEPAETV